MDLEQETRRSGDQKDLFRVPPLDSCCFFETQHEDTKSSKTNEDRRWHHRGTAAASSGRLKGVSQENTDPKYKTGDTPSGLVFASVFSCEAGRFTAGQLDAPPQNGPPTAACSASAPLRLSVEMGNSLATLRQLCPNGCPTTRRRTPQMERRTHPSPAAPGASRYRPGSTCCNPMCTSFPRW